jgi:hypothetical protein
VFCLCVSADFELRHLSHRRIELCQLPLEPIATLKARQEQTQTEDRKKRLRQFLSLPLAEMTKHTKDGENGKVICTICSGSRNSESYDKDYWADEHFRMTHWELYCTMRGISPDSSKLPSIASYLKYKSKPTNTMSMSTVSSHVSPANWICLKDKMSDRPILEDWEVRELGVFSQVNEPHICGPVMVRRFVVIQEGLKSCLCLGIHT